MISMNFSLEKPKGKKEKERKKNRCECTSEEQEEKKKQIKRNIKTHNSSRTKSITSLQQAKSFASSSKTWKIETNGEIILQKNI